MKKFLSLLLSAVMLFTVAGGQIIAYALDIAHGVDVSEWNETVDYDSVKKAGNEFVMIRLGYGTAHLDKSFEQNVKAAYEAGMDFGIYFYSYAFNTAEAKQEADFVISTLARMDYKYKEYFNLPVAFDLEDASITEDCKNSKTQITNIMTTFLDTVKGAGYVPMIYANQDWFENYIDTKTVASKNYKVWLADWRDVNVSSISAPVKIKNTDIEADMWQYYGTDVASPTSFDKNVIFYAEDLIHSHTYAEKVDGSNKKATCTEDGMIDAKCSSCGYEKTAVIPKASNIKLSRISIAYTGTVQRPSVTVTDRTGKALTYKKDFTVDYSDWSSTNVGEYKVIVKLIGNYEGTYEYNYKIVAQTNVTPKLNRNVITTNGTVQRPSVTVTDSKGKQLVYKQDFTVNYSNWNSKDVGRYTVTVTMQGNYSGTYTYAYYINPKPTTLSSVTGRSKGFTVKWNKQTSQTTGYQIQYSTRSDFKNAATIYGGNANTTSKTITGRVGKTRYYVRIRTYKNNGGKYSYSSWSSAKSVVTLK